MARIPTLSLAGLALSASAAPALAHHPLAGETPTTVMHGLLSGIGHPIIGLDHLAFVIAAGVASLLIGRPLLGPLIFVVATVLGTLVHLAAIGLPAVEAVIALSVLAIGAAVATGRASAAVVLPIMGVAGLFHGHAYGEAVFGAEATPVVAYLLGFGATQWLIAVAAGAAVVKLAGSATPQAARLGGAAVAGAGALLVGEHALAAIGLG